MPSHSTTRAVRVTNDHNAWRKDGVKLENPSAYDLDTTVSWVDSVTFGENFEDWRQRLRDGLATTTSMSGSLQTLQVNNGVLTWTTNSQPLPTSIVRGEIVGSFRLTTTSPGDPSTISSSAANAEALGRFVRRIYDVQHSYQGGAFVRALGQTLQTIRNPARGLRRLVDDWLVRARRIRGQRGLPSPIRKRTVAENLADAWLEVQFGWRPLLSDIRSGSKALESYISGQGQTTRRITARGHVHGAPVVGTSGQLAATPQMFVDLRTSVEDDCVVVYRGAMRVEARDPRVMDSKLLGFDLASWGPTAWELVPYSFLVDYFSNVGDVILGWSNLGTRLTWCNRTIIRTKERRSWSQISPLTDLTGSDGITISTNVPATYVRKSRSVSRAEYTGTLVPDFAFEIPSLGSLKWLNIAALIASRNSDRRWSFD